MKSKLFLISCVFLLSTAFISIAFASQFWPASVDKLLADSKAAVKSIKMGDFNKIVEAKDYDMILDVREPVEYSRNHVPGAVNIPRGVLEFAIWKKVGFPFKVDYNKKIFIYCAIGGRAALAGKSMQDLGFKNVTVVDMFFREWVKAGYTVQK